MATSTRQQSGADHEVGKLTVVLPKPVIRAVRVLAAERDATIQAVVEEALRAWLELQEERDDAAAYDAAVAEIAQAGEAPVGWAEIDRARATRGAAGTE